MSAVDNFFEDDSLDDSNSSESADDGIASAAAGTEIYDRYALTPLVWSDFENLLTIRIFGNGDFQIFWWPTVEK